MKDRIMEIAENISFDEHDSEFYDLPEKLQNEVWKKAEELYADELADLGDRLADEFKIHGKILWVPKRRMKK